MQELHACRVKIFGIVRGELKLAAVAITGAPQRIGLASRLFITMIMKKVGLFEAKQKLSELVKRASEGERIGITRRGKLAAYFVPARNGVSLEEAFERIERIRLRAKPLPKGMTIKDLIEEGRR